ncbi:hypothetical protein D918_07835 [Trichuris suis]|nr:hypothetical protein D918_07835 [Trichuris suis]
MSKVASHRLPFSYRKCNQTRSMVELQRRRHVCKVETQRETEGRSSISQIQSTNWLTDQIAGRPMDATEKKTTKCVTSSRRHMQVHAATLCNVVKHAYTPLGENSR